MNDDRDHFDERIGDSRPKAAVEYRHRAYGFCRLCGTIHAEDSQLCRGDFRLVFPEDRR